MTVRRSLLVQDSLQQVRRPSRRLGGDEMLNSTVKQISKNTANLKKGLKITFEGEDGIDAGTP